MMNTFNYQPWDFSSQLPLFTIFDNLRYYLSHTNVLNRAQLLAVGTVFNFVMDHVFYPESRFDVDKKSRISFYENNVNMFIGDGIYGMRDINQEAQNTA